MLRSQCSDFGVEWQRLGVHGAEASEASRSGVKARALRAVRASRPTHCATELSSSSLAAPLASRTHPAWIGLPEFSDQYVAEIDQALPSARRLECHRVSYKSLPNEALLAVPPDLTIASDASNYPTRRIPESRLAPSGWRRTVNLRWCSLPQRLVRSYLVVSLPPPSRPPFLPTQVARRGAR